jgi:3-isopropylmalate/(R)-2-methylmalate dehydratase small subunit
LLDYGFKVVLSSRFGDIFRGNSGKAGLLAAVVEESTTERLWSLVEADPTTEVTIDLVRKEVRARDLVESIELDDYTRWRLLEGLDDIGISLSHDDDIAAYEANRPSFKPVTL